MSEIKSRADLFEAAANMMRMCDEAGIEHELKHRGLLVRGNVFMGDTFETSTLCEYEFPLAVVEGKPVFKGDELYYGQDKVKMLGNNSVMFVEKGATQSPVYWHLFSWLPPKPRTVMVELLREDAEYYAKAATGISLSLNRLSEASRKALENGK